MLVYNYPVCFVEQGIRVAPFTFCFISVPFSSGMPGNNTCFVFECFLLPWLHTYGGLVWWCRSTIGCYGAVGRIIFKPNYHNICRAVINRLLICHKKVSYWYTNKNSLSLNIRPASPPHICGICVKVLRHHKNTWLYFTFCHCGVDW